MNDVNPNTRADEIVTKFVSEGKLKTGELRELFDLLGELTDSETLSLITKCEEAERERVHEKQWAKDSKLQAKMDKREAKKAAREEKMALLKKARIWKRAVRQRATAEKRAARMEALEEKRALKRAERLAKKNEKAKAKLNAKKTGKFDRKPKKAAVTPEVADAERVARITKYMNDKRAKGEDPLTPASRLPRARTPR